MCGFLYATSGKYRGSEHYVYRVYYMNHTRVINNIMHRKKSLSQRYSSLGPKKKSNIFIDMITIFYEQCE